MTLFPFFQDIEGKTFLVIGGGVVAAEKVHRLRLFTDRILVIAEQTEINEVPVLLRPFRDEDIALGDYVIGATDDPALNAHIAALCRETGKPVNIVDDPALCSFVFPALVKRGDLTAAITTNGKSPAFAQYVRHELEDILPDRTEAILEELHNMRSELKLTVPDQRDRARLLKERLTELLEEP